MYQTVPNHSNPTVDEGSVDGNSIRRMLLGDAKDQGEEGAGNGRVGLDVDVDTCIELHKIQPSSCTTPRLDSTQQPRDELDFATPKGDTLPSRKIY